MKTNPLIVYSYPGATTLHQLFKQFEHESLNTWFSFTVDKNDPDRILIIEHPKEEK